ncbi:MAG: hypothetical protein M1140_11450 [Chloroflexi bacterium]|nr:hypothetical protein [Chloroflexota bacterium]
MPATLTAAPSSTATGTLAAAAAIQATEQTGAATATSQPVPPAKAPRPH